MLGTFVKLFLADARIVSAFVFEKNSRCPHPVCWDRAALDRDNEKILPGEKCTHAVKKSFCF
jgi:hypothetical protein